MMIFLPLYFWYNHQKETEEPVMLLARSIAKKALSTAHDANPGPWAAHSRYVAQACEAIALRCPTWMPPMLISTACFTTLDGTPV